MKELNYNDYKNTIKNGSCVVTFGASWCRDCVFAEPILKELANEYKNISFYHVNVDEDESIRSDFGIRHIPTILYLKDGKEVCERVVEPKSRQIIENGLQRL